MIAQTLTPVLVGNKVVLDIGQWENITVQVIGGTGTISLLGSNDEGAQTGTIIGGPNTAENFTAVQAVNLTTGAAATAVTGTNLFRISPVSFRFLQIGDGATAAATKILVFANRR